ncbi:MAG: hypothetical protein S0880_08195 [Actinomycetota bacterium]|nr:hypothetical protein [Actinomycetota bacterium]
MARRLLVLVVVCTLSILLGARPTGAEDEVPGGGAPDDGADVGAGEGRYHVEIWRMGGAEHIRGVSGGNRTTTRVCWDRLAQAGSGTVPDWYSTPPAPPGPDHRLVYVSCEDNGLTSDYGWHYYAPTDVVDFDAAAADAARRAVEDVLVPDMGISVSPASGTIVGIETWFTLEGWDGQPLTETVVALGVEVAVTMRADSMTWDFGDGSGPTEASPPADPDAPDAIHRYRGRSTIDGPDHGHPLTLDVSVGGSYTFLGLGPYDLDPLTLQVLDSVVVREVQAVQR